MRKHRYEALGALAVLLLGAAMCMQHGRPAMRPPSHATAPGLSNGASMYDECYPCFWAPADACIARWVVEGRQKSDADPSRALDLDARAQPAITKRIKRRERQEVPR